MDENTPVERRLGQTLRDRDETMAVAESCTGGLVGSLVTDVAGASEYFLGGLIAYSNRAKLGRLAVSREALESHGAVSKPVAKEMAQHVRDETGATWAVSTTGYADDPDESASHPAGTVYVGVAYAGGATGRDPYSVVEYHQFDGSRRDVKAQIARQALESLLAQVRSSA